MSTMKSTMKRQKGIKISEDSDKTNINIKLQENIYKGMYKRNYKRTSEETER